MTPPIKRDEEREEEVQGEATVGRADQLDDENEEAAQERVGQADERTDEDEGMRDERGDDPSDEQTELREDV